MRASCALDTRVDIMQHYEKSLFCLGQNQINYVKTKTRLGIRLAIFCSKSSRLCDSMGTVLLLSIFLSASPSACAATGQSQYTTSRLGSSVKQKKVGEPGSRSSLTRFVLRFRSPACAPEADIGERTRRWVKFIAALLARPNDHQHSGRLVSREHCS